MSHYTKLWSHLLDSSIWREPNELRVLWIILLAKKDKDHIVRCSVPTLADMVRITPDQCESLLGKLMSPDKWSANKEHDGRRLLPVEGGWFVVSGAKYQDYMREDQRREAVRNAVAKFRQKAKPNGTKPKTNWTKRNAREFPTP